MGSCEDGRPDARGKASLQSGVSTDHIQVWERDQALLARSGDSKAFGRLVKHYSARIYTHLVRLVQDRHEAEDLTQETFLKAYRFLAQYDTARPFRNWIYAIATNTGLNALRARRRRGRFVSLDGEDEMGRPLVQKIAARSGGCAHMEQLELGQRVAAAVRQLPPRTAALIHLHYYEGLSIREAASMLDMNEGAAKVALCRARKSLRERLVEEEDP
jgi:RNA polymerase sigma-70 factor, ECF subfamily